MWHLRCRCHCYQLLLSPSGSRRGEERQGRWCESVGQGLQKRRRRRKRGIFGSLFVAKLKLHLDWGMDKISDYCLKASVFSEMYINDYTEKFWVEGYNLTKYFLIVMWQSECSFMFKIDGRNCRQNLDEFKDSFSSIPPKLWDGDPNLLWPMCKNSGIGGNFTGSAEDFVAAGDSVLVRIKHHMNEGMHLFVSWSPIAVLCFFLRFCFRIFILSILKECCLIVTLCIYYLHSESYRYVDVWMQSFQVTPVSWCSKCNFRICHGLQHLLK